MLSVTDAQLQAWLIAFMLPLTRILALIASAPFFNNRAVPARIRLAIGVAISLAILPAIPEIRPIPADAWFTLGALAHEFIIGLAIGFSMRVFLAAVDLAGEMIGLQMGLSFAVFFNPQTGGQSSVLAEFLNLVTLLIFIVLDAHLLLIETLAKSFEWIPVAQATYADGFVHITRSAASLFVLGVLMALPMIATLLIANIALGILTRAAPQLNLFAVGFPVTLTVGYSILLFSLNLLAPILQRLFNYGFESIDTMLRLMSSGGV